MIIYKIDKTLPNPVPQTDDSAGADLYSREDIMINPGEYRNIPCNIIVDYKDIEGSFLAILPRSGLFRKTGLIMTNSMGVIDRDYNGPEDEIQMSLFNTGKDKVLIRHGDRIGQMMFLNYIRISDKTKNLKLEVLDAVILRGQKSRGGFGSTGVR